MLMSEDMAFLNTRHVTKQWALPLLGLSLCLSAAGCVLEADTGPPPPPGYVDGYEPSYYDGYVVYYDDVGRPYYYGNGGVVWVSPGVPEYGVLVNHYRVYGPAYHRWYTRYGHAYRRYPRYYRR
jgi:hypothetical protein